MNTGEKIRFVRRQHKLTQQELATHLNISQRAYSKIENNEVSIRIERLEKIAQLLNVQVKELLPDSPTQQIESVSYSQIGNGHFINNPNNNERELWEKIFKRQEEEISYLKGLIDVFKK